MLKFLNKISLEILETVHNCLYVYENICPKTFACFFISDETDLQN